MLTVEPESPAQPAGVADGDVIVAFGARPVAGIDDLHRLLTEEQMGLSVPITVLRQTAKLDLEIVPADRNPERRE